MSTSTGPGRPVVAMWKASWMMRGMSWADVTSSLCLVTERVTPTMSHSWKASVPMASASGVTMLVAPGPLVTMATPGRPVAWAKPSAMWPAPCSWRTRM